MEAHQLLHARCKILVQCTGGCQRAAFPNFARSVSSGLFCVRFSGDPIIDWTKQDGQGTTLTGRNSRELGVNLGVESKLWWTLVNLGVVTDFQAATFRSVLDSVAYTILYIVQTCFSYWFIIRLRKQRLNCQQSRSEGVQFWQVVLLRINFRVFLGSDLDDFTSLIISSVFLSVFFTVFLTPRTTTVVDIMLAVCITMRVLYCPLSGEYTLFSPSIIYENLIIITDY